MIIGFLQISYRNLKIEEARFDASKEIRDEIIRILIQIRYERVKKIDKDVKK